MAIFIIIFLAQNIGLAEIILEKDASALMPARPLNNDRISDTLDSDKDLQTAGRDLIELIRPLRQLDLPGADAIRTISHCLRDYPLLFSGTIFQHTEGYSFRLSLVGGGYCLIGFSETGEEIFATVSTPAASQQKPHGSVSEGLKAINRTGRFRDRAFTRAKFQEERDFSETTVRTELTTLVRLGILEIAGKEGNANLYRLTERYRRASPAFKRKIQEKVLKGLPARSDTGELRRARREVSAFLDISGAHRALEELTGFQNLEGRLEALRTLKKLERYDHAKTKVLTEVDLHTHTYHSDGLKSPAALVYEAYSKGVKAIAITDHNSFEGIPEAIEAGRILGVEVIPGIEMMTADYERFGTEVLVYFPDAGRFLEWYHSDESVQFRKRMNAAKAKHEQLTKRLLRDLKKDYAGLEELIWKDATDMTKERPVLPGDLPLVLWEKFGKESLREIFGRNDIETIQDIYDEVFSPYMMEYLKTVKFIKAGEVAALARRNGGITCLAHPKQYLKSIKGRRSAKRRALKEYVESLGVQAIQVNDVRNSPEDVEMFVSIADELGLIKISGSDTHSAGISELGSGALTETSPRGNLKPELGRYSSVVALDPTRLRREALTRENVREHTAELARIDHTRGFGELEGGYWDEARFLEDERASTGTPLEGKWDMSEMAVVDGQPVGYCIGIKGGNPDFGVPADAWHMLRLAIDPDYRNMQIGSRLIKNFAEKADTAGVQDIYLDVTAAREDTVRFYRRCGFEVVAEEVHQGTPAFKMKASVTDLLANLSDARFEEPHADNWIVMPDGARIHRTARVDPGCTVEGPRTIIGPDAVVTRGSVIVNAIVKSGARVEASLVMTLDDSDKWEYKEKSDLMVASSRPAVIEEGATLVKSEVYNSRVGKNTEMRRSFAEHSDIGEDNYFESTKLSLAKTKRDVRATWAEISEGVFGFGFEYDGLAMGGPSYFEGIFSNRFPVARMTAGTLAGMFAGKQDLSELTQAEVAALAKDPQRLQEFLAGVEFESIKGVPHASRYSPYDIYSVFTGRNLPPEDGILEGIEGRPGEQQSQYARNASAICFVAPNTDIAPRIKGRPDPRRAKDTLTNAEYTYQAPFSLAGHGGPMIHGQQRPGVESHTLSPYKTRHMWTFTHCPGLIFEAIEKMAGSLPEGEKDRFDKLPLQAIETAFLMVLYDLNELKKELNELESKEEKTAADTRRIASLKRQERSLREALPLYMRNLRANRTRGIWECENGRPSEGWEKANGIWEHVSEEGLLARLSGDADYRQHSPGEVLNSRPVEPPVKPRDPPRDVLTGRDLALIDGRSALSGEPKVRKSRTARIGENVRFFGNGEVIIKGNVKLENVVIIAEGKVVIDEDTEVLLGKIEAQEGETVEIGRGVRLYYANVRNSSVDSGTKAHFARLNKSRIGADNELNAFADIDHTTTDAECILGHVIRHCNLARGFISRYLPTEVHWLNTPPVTVKMFGEDHKMANPMNVGAGAHIMGRRGHPVTIADAAFIGSNVWINADAVIRGSFVLGEVPEGKELLPFTYYDGTAGVEDIGALLEDKWLGVLFRTFLYRGKLYTAPDTRWAGDYSVNRLIKKLKNRSVDELALQAAGENTEHTEAQLEMARSRCNRVLTDGRWDMDFGEFVNGRYEYAEETDSWRWVPDAANNRTTRRGYIALEDGSRAHIVTKRTADTLNITLVKDGYFTEGGHQDNQNYLVSARLIIGSPTKIHIDGIGTHPGARGQGFSHVMLDTIFKGLAEGALMPGLTFEEGATIGSHTVNPLLAKAQRKYGFKKVDMPGSIRAVMGEKVPGELTPIYISPAKREIFTQTMHKQYPDRVPDEGVCGIFELVDEPPEGGEKVEFNADYRLQFDRDTLARMDRQSNARIHFGETPLAVSALAEFDEERGREESASVEAAQFSEVDLRQFVNGFNPDLQQAIKRARTVRATVVETGEVKDVIRSYPEDCFTAADIAQAVIRARYGNSVEIVKVEGNPAGSYMPRHVGLIITEKRTGHRYYLSMSEGPFRMAESGDMVTVRVKDGAGEYTAAVHTDEYLLRYEREFGDTPPLLFRIESDQDLRTKAKLSDAEEDTYSRLSDGERDRVMAHLPGGYYPARLVTFSAQDLRGYIDGIYPDLLKAIEEGTKAEVEMAVDLASAETKTETVSLTFPKSCEEAALVAQRLLRERYGDNIETRLVAGEPVRAEELHIPIHLGLDITDKATGRRFYLSFIQGQFEIDGPMPTRLVRVLGTDKYTRIVEPAYAERFMQSEAGRRPPQLVEIESDSDILREANFDRLIPMRPIVQPATVNRILSHLPGREGEAVTVRDFTPEIRSTIAGMFRISGLEEFARLLKGENITLQWGRPTVTGADGRGREVALSNRALDDGSGRYVIIVNDRFRTEFEAFLADIGEGRTEALSRDYLLKMARFLGHEFGEVLAEIYLTSPGGMNMAADDPRLPRLEEACGILSELLVYRGLRRALGRKGYYNRRVADRFNKRLRTNRHLGEIREIIQLSEARDDERIGDLIDEIAGMSPDSELGARLQRRLSVVGVKEGLLRSEFDIVRGIITNQVRPANVSPSVDQLTRLSRNALSLAKESMRQAAAPAAQPAEPGYGSAATAHPELEPERWHQIQITSTIDVAELRTGLRNIHEEMAYLNRQLEEEQQLLEDDFTDQVLDQYADAAERFNEVILNGPMDAVRFEEEYLLFHSRLGARGVVDPAGEYGGTVRVNVLRSVEDLFASLFTDDFEERLAYDPVREAARAYVTLVNLQPFNDGNKRAASLVMNYILMKAGCKPFMLTEENMVEYQRLVSPIREENEIDEEAFREFLDEEVVLVDRAVSKRLEQIAATRRQSPDSDDSLPPTTASPEFDEGKEADETGSTTASPGWRTSGANQEGWRGRSYTALAEIARRNHSAEQDQASGGKSLRVCSDYAFGFKEFAGDETPVTVQMVHTLAPNATEVNSHYWISAENGFVVDTAPFLNPLLTRVSEMDGTEWAVVGPEDDRFRPYYCLSVTTNVNPREGFDARDTARLNVVIPPEISHLAGGQTLVEFEPGRNAQDVMRELVAKYPRLGEVISDRGEISGQFMLNVDAEGAYSSVPDMLAHGELTIAPVVDEAIFIRTMDRLNNLRLAAQEAESRNEILIVGIDTDIGNLSEYDEGLFKVLEDLRARYKNLIIVPEEGRLLKAQVNGQVQDAKGQGKKVTAVTLAKTENIQRKCYVGLRDEVRLISIDDSQVLDGERLLSSIPITELVERALADKDFRELILPRPDDASQIEADEIRRRYREEARYLKNA